MVKKKVFYTLLLCNLLFIFDEKDIAENVRQMRKNEVRLGENER